jgi:DNA replication protein DnaC
VEQQEYWFLITARAFGMEACKYYYKTKYVRLPDLLLDLEIARNDGTYHGMNSLVESIVR